MFILGALLFFWKVISHLLKRAAWSTATKNTAVKTCIRKMVFHMLFGERKPDSERVIQGGLEMVRYYNSNKEHWIVIVRPIIKRVPQLTFTGTLHNVLREIVIKSEKFTASSSGAPQWKPWNPSTMTTRSYSSLSEWNRLLRVMTEPVSPRFW